MTDGPSRRIKVGALAHARSGDKGNTANIGVLAYTPGAYQWLVRELAPERVKAHFAEVCRGDVVRYELPHLLALNFVLHDVLGGGGTRSLRVDAQGKALGQAMLELEIPAPPPEIRDDALRAREEGR